MRAASVCALVFVSVFVPSSRADEPAPNEWIKLEKAAIVGQRWDVPVAYVPALQRFMVLGGRTSFGEYRQGGRPYDQLALRELK